MSLHTKLGEKVSILVERIVDLWEGNGNKKKKNSKNNVKVSQPISQNQSAMNQSINQNMGSTSISALPQSQPVQQSPDFNNMYQQDSTPLVGAASPETGMEGFGPAAANDMIGGSFGSAFGW